MYVQTESFVFTFADMEEEGLITCPTATRCGPDVWALFELPCCQCLCVYVNCNHYAMEGFLTVDTPTRVVEHISCCDRLELRPCFESTLLLSPCGLSGYGKTMAQWIALLLTDYCFIASPPTHSV